MTMDDFITGEKFVKVADFVFTPKHTEIDYNPQVNTFEEGKLGPVNIIYTHTIFNEVIFWRIKDIPAKFVIVTHNSDKNIYDTKAMPPNVIRWYSQNVCARDPRLFSLPIGLENSRWYPDVHKKERMLRQIQHPRQCRNLVYVNHNIQTNPGERTEPYKVLENKPFSTVKYGFNPRSFDAYLDDIYNHKFVVSPPGNGVDTHRKWETLYLGSIPIEKRNINNSFYEDLPICFVDSWSQITEDFLNKEYARITGMSWDLSKLKMSYWLDQIRACK